MYIYIYNYYVLVCCLPRLVDAALVSAPHDYEEYQNPGS